MSELTSALWIRVLLDATLKAVFVVGLSAATALAMRRTAAARRHLLWSLVLTGIAALPFVVLVSGEWSLPLPQAVGSFGAVSAPSSAVHVLPPAASASLAASATTSPGAGLDQGPPSPLALAIFLTWLLGVGVVTCWQALGSVRAARQRRKADLVVDEGIREMVADAGRIVGLRRVPRVRVGGELRVPAVAGWPRATILLPDTAVEWDGGVLRNVLVHEMAHVRRRDLLTHGIARAACAIHWFNPLVWWAVRRLRTERERACDDYVLRAGVGPEAYADQLIRIARGARPQYGRPINALAMARPRQLEGRILSILSSSLPRGPVSPRSRILITLFALGVASAAGPIRFGTPKQRDLWQFRSLLTQHRFLAQDAIWIHGPSTFMYSEDGRRFRGRVEGSVGLSNDSLRVLVVLPAASLRIEELARLGTIVRLLEATPGPGDSPSLTWSVEGIHRAIDSDATEWMRDALPGAIRTAKWAELRRLQLALDQDPFRQTERLFVGEFTRLTLPVLRTFVQAPVEQLRQAADEAGARLFHALSLDVGEDTVRVSTLGGPFSAVVPPLVSEVLADRGLTLPSSAVRPRWEAALARAGSQTETYWSTLNAHLIR